MRTADPPLYEPIAVPEGRPGTERRKTKLVIGPEYLRWLGELVTSVDKKPAREVTVRLSNQAASLATTPLPLGSVPAGIWRVSYAVRVTTPASVSSSIQVSLLWTEGGVTQTESGAVQNGNLTTTREGETRILRVDGDTPISYATTYASVGTPMQYRLDVVAELLAADES